MENKSPVISDDITEKAETNWGCGWAEVIEAIDSDFRLDYEQFLLDVLQDTKEAQRDASDAYWKEKLLKDNWDGEHCQMCGRAYRLAWSAPDALWREVVKGKYNLLDLECFLKLAEAENIKVGGLTSDAFKDAYWQDSIAEAVKAEKEKFEQCLILYRSPLSEITRGKMGATFYVLDEAKFQNLTSSTGGKGEK